jgi:hypothetical protein
MDVKGLVNGFVSGWTNVESSGNTTGRTSERSDSIGSKTFEILKRTTARNNAISLGIVGGIVARIRKMATTI